MPYYVKIEFPLFDNTEGEFKKFAFTLPITFTIENISDTTSDLEILLSMNHKEPSLRDNDMQVIKEASQGKAFKFMFGEPGSKFLEQKRYQNSVFMVLKSS